jgi:hypothetical protein
METGLMDIHHLTNCRRHLAAMEIALKQAKDEYEQVKAYRERKAIGELNGSAGKNEEERRRNLAVALAEDVVYQEALGQLRDAEANVTTAQAELEIANDQRRAEEWGIRLQMTITLDRQRIFPDSSDDLEMAQAAIDEAVAEPVYQSISGELASARSYTVSTTYSRGAEPKTVINLKKAEQEINELYS